MSRFSITSAIWTFVLTACLGAPAFAQDVPYFYNSNIDYTAAHTVVQNNAALADVSPRTIYGRGAPQATPQSLKFTPSTTQRRVNVADYVANVARVAPDYAPKLQAEFASGAIFGQYGQLMHSVGLDANDVGDNLAIWWITAWEASMGRPVETPPAAYGQVKIQVQRILAARFFADMNNIDKQKFADNLMIQTLILANHLEQAKENPEIARQLASGTIRGAARYGFQLEAMTLTSEGFVPK
jgi:hypothetical protein